MKNELKVSKGDIFILDEGQTFGNEIMKRRPYIIISDPRLYLLTGYILAVPVTSSHYNEFGRISITTNCNIEGQAIATQITSVDLKARNPQFVGKVAKKSLVKIVDIAVKTINF